MRSNDGGHPNLRNWDLQDVENWFEAEGSVAEGTGAILITQKRKEPLQKSCGALKKHASLAGCPILKPGAKGFEMQPGIEDSGRFVKTFKRVKTVKALNDLERAEQRLQRKREHHRGPARRAIQILEGSST